jgi:hypothetical protein
MLIHALGLLCALAATTFAAAPIGAHQGRIWPAVVAGFIGAAVWLRPEPGWHRAQRNDTLPGLAETAETRTSAVAGMAITAVYGALIGGTSSGRLEHRP